MLNQPRDWLQILQTESITGTSTSTPTTVANAAPEFAPNRMMPTAPRQFKEIARPNQRTRSGDFVRHLQATHQLVGQTGFDIGLDDDGHRNQRNGQPAMRETRQLEGENENQLQQQRHIIAE